MKKSTYFIFLASAVIPGTAYAGTCEDSFKKTGSPISGIKYHAEITVLGVTPENALLQFRGAASAKGYDILADESATGTLLIEKPKSFGNPAEKSFVKAAAAGSVTTIVIDTKLSSGTFASGKTAKADYCDMLGSIKSGKDGIAAAKQGRSSVSAAPPRSVDAVLLTQEIAEEGEKNSAAVNARYSGKSFIVKGFFARVSTVTNKNIVYYKTPRSTNELVFHSGKFRRLPSIICEAAPGQSAYILSLNEGGKLKMQGVFSKYDAIGDRFILKDCVAA